jgi:hypothetical protein
MIHEFCLKCPINRAINQNPSAVNLSGDNVQCATGAKGTLSAILSNNVYMCTYSIPNDFRDGAISLYSSRTVDMKETLPTGSNTAIYFSSDEVSTVFSFFLRDLSPGANNTDQATAACWLS